MPDDADAPRAAESRDPDPHDRGSRQRLAFEVARLIVQDGMSAGKVARHFYPTEYQSKRGQSRALMRVKRALHHAVRLGILKLYPLPHEDLANRLKDRYHWVQSFTVVHDEAMPRAPFDQTSVFLAAARKIAQEIHVLASRLKKKESIVIANAGGFTLSCVVNFLATEAIIPEEPRRLKFVSLNAARKADAYHISANFLAVRMSQIYGGEHIAVLPRAPDRIRREYDDAMGDIDLLISSAGTRRGFLFLWHDEVFGDDHEIPPEVIGDLAFIPINERGARVELPFSFRKHVEEDLQPRPRHDELLSLASKGKVIVVCGLFPEQDTEPSPEESPAARGRVTRAILQGCLASKCILGSSVARKVLEQ